MMINFSKIPAKITMQRRGTEVALASVTDPLLSFVRVDEGEELRLYSLLLPRLLKVPTQFE